MKKAKKAKKAVAKKRPVAKKAAKRAAPKKVAKPKDGRPSKFWWPTLSTFLTVRDGQAAIEFYARAFGFETYGDVMRGDDGRVQHAGMRLGEAAIMFGPPEGANGLQLREGGAHSQTLYVYVPDVDALAGRAQRAGAMVVQALTDQDWRDRTAVFVDPDGYHWTFATHLD